MKTTKAKLIGKIRNLRDSLSAIERSEWLRDNKKLVGTCWKYRNSYPLTEKPSDYWYVYRKLVVIDVNGQSFLATSFQTDNRGCFRIDVKEWCSGPHGWEPCSEQEFNKALAELKKNIASLNP